MDEEIKNIINEYKYGKINFVKALSKLVEIGISKKQSEILLTKISRDNIIFISDYMTKVDKKNITQIKKNDDYLFPINYDDSDEYHPDEYFFDIEFEEWITIFLFYKN